MATRIRFVAQGSNSLLGGFSPGDTATVGHEFARHLVEEARVAQYLEAPLSAAVEPEKKSRRSRRDAGA